MCLGIPMQIVAVENGIARCTARGVERSASLLMLDEPVAVGDYLIINLGYAFQKVSEEEAAAAWELFDQILAEDR